MKHKIVFFDMDGTLYQTENDVIQESALDAIQTLKDKGYIVCAATGRPLNQMKLILQRVCVVAQGEKEKEAQAAGADFVGGADIIEKISKGWFDFDVLVATPDMMGQLGRLGRVLGPKGLMPNPKTGTVTMDVAKAIDEIKKGKVTYRVDKEGNINLAIGKTSFTDEALVENFNAIFNTIAKARPATVKGAYMKNLVVSTTMGPGIHVEIVK